MNSTLTKPGAHVLADGVLYRVWAPGKKRVEVVLSGSRAIALAPAADGYFEGTDPQGRPGDLYRFRLDGEGPFPDPASRFQPEGVLGPSAVVRSGAYPWRHEAPKISLDDLVIYEVHTGTFTPEGTYAAAKSKLDHLVDLGVNAIELMPLADFPGRWNWGYDGVVLYAPSRAYGKPDDLRGLIDAAHSRGLSVILDAVYNHLGPDGNFLGSYSRDYFNPSHKTPWGDALNFDGTHCTPVREFFLGNIIYWMEEFHFDGFRLDAVHAILDDSPLHILAEIAAAVHERGGFIVAEDERNEALLATPAADGGIGLDGLWADDFHHSVRVAITGEQESYLKNFTGSVDELGDILRNGWHYRGQAAPASGERRGTECMQLPPHAFVYCISNHDQVGNRAFGERLTAACSPAAYRAASALLCLSPYTPMLFMGQEWAASSPFLYFTDHNDELGRLVTEGRRREFKGFAAFGDEASIGRIPDPQAERTFQNSKLPWAELAEPGTHAATLALYREVLRLRRSDPALRARRRDQWTFAAMTRRVLSMHCTGGGGPGERALILVSLVGGDEVDVPGWTAVFSSNDPAYGGPAGVGTRAWEGRVRFDEPELIILKRESELARGSGTGV